MNITYDKKLINRRDELVRLLKIDINKKIEDLSLGNLKKVGIVLALMHEPEILILDEPTSGLDPIMQNTFHDILLKEKAKADDIDSKITQTKKYEIKHGNLKFIAVPVDDDIVGTYKYELYYNNNLLDTNRLKDNARYGTTKAYLFSGDNSAYVLVSEIVPVAAHSRYSIIVIDNNGKVLLSQIVISPKIDVNNNEINYSFETRMQEEQGLGVTAEHSDDFCQYLRDNYNDDNYVVKGNYSYKYDNNELILIKNEEKTIKTYKENYNCN